MESYRENRLLIWKLIISVAVRIRIFPTFWNTRVLKKGLLANHKKTLLIRSVSCLNPLHVLCSKSMWSSSRTPRIIWRTGSSCCNYTVYRHDLLLLERMVSGCLLFKMPRVEMYLSSWKKKHLVFIVQRYCQTSGDSSMGLCCRVAVPT